MLPVIRLASWLPVPAMSALPVSVRFSIAPLAWIGVGEAEGDRRLDRVDAVAAVLIGDVAGIVDDVEIVAGAAAHVVRTQAAIDDVVAAEAGEEVGAGIAGEEVGEVVAGAVDIGGADKREVFDVALGVLAVGEAEVDGRSDRVDAVATDLIGDVGSIVDDVEVVAGPTAHVVRTRAAIDDVVAVAAEDHVVAGESGKGVGAEIAGDDVGESVAGGVDIGGADKPEVFDVAVGLLQIGQAEARRRFHQVVAVAALLTDEVLGIVHPVGVIPIAALHPVGTTAAIERIVAIAIDLGQLIVAAESVEDIVTIETQHEIGAVVAGQYVGKAGTNEVLDVDEGVAGCVTGRAHTSGERDDDTLLRQGVIGEVVSLAAIQAVGAADALHNVVVRQSKKSIIPVAAPELIGASTAIDRVVALAAIEGVVAALAGEEVDAGSPVDVIFEAVAEEGVGEVRADKVFDAEKAVALGVAACTSTASQVDRHAGGRTDIARGVVTTSTVKLVGSCAAVKLVIVLPTKNHIVAAEPEDAVVSSKSVDDVGAVGDTIGTVDEVIADCSSYVGHVRLLSRAVCSAAARCWRPGSKRIRPRWVPPGFAARFEANRSASRPPIGGDERKIGPKWDGKVDGRYDPAVQVAALALR